MSLSGSQINGRSKSRTASKIKRLLRRTIDLIYTDHSTFKNVNACCALETISLIQGLSAAKVL